MSISLIHPMPFDDSGNGGAVILLHGFPFNRSMWREQIDFLSSCGYRVIAPDLRGLGENRSDDEVATMEDMARDVAALSDELKIDSAIICGLSMGCFDRSTELQPIRHSEHARKQEDTFGRAR